MEQNRAPTRRAALRWIAAGAAGPAGLRYLHAADFPERPVKIVIANAPGGALDTVTRILSEKMSTSLGQQVMSNTSQADPARSVRLSCPGDPGTVI